MAQRLVEFYNEALRVGGMKAKLRLAMITCIPAVIAGEWPDSPENVEKFTNAMKEIRKEFH